MQRQLLHASHLLLVIGAARPRGASIELELRHRERLANYRAQEWLQLLTRLGVENVRIRGSKPGDAPAVTNRGTAGPATLSRRRNSHRPRTVAFAGRHIRPRRRETTKGLFRSPGGRRRRAADGAGRPFRPHRKGTLRRARRSSQPIDFETKGQPPRLSSSDCGPNSSSNSPSIRRPIAR